MSLHIKQSIIDLQNDLDYACRYADQLSCHIQNTNCENHIFHLKRELSNVIDSIYALKLAIQILEERI